ncbi:hypothetical protein GH714_024622 [Hevea brasiliensis]|uniref:Uncharacterized protein n=1 Tax=Hevea brasiliensis TaxID=3981 RepID=A0A6A6LBN9_HEVBR|nr:hypothetical protein GH714_024622 [Hevea brasiliensis]
MESPPHSPQTSPLQVLPLSMRPPNPDFPPQETPPPPRKATYKRKIRSKSTRPIASAPPLSKRKEPPTPFSEPPPKNPKTSASTQAKSPSSSKKQTSIASQVSKLPWPLQDTTHKATFKRLKERRVQPTRGTSSGTVGKSELFMLWCAFQKVKVSPGYFFCEHVLHIATKSISDIVLGFNLPHSDIAQPATETEPIAQPEAQPVPSVPQHSTEPAPPSQPTQAPQQLLHSPHLLQLNRPHPQPLLHSTKALFTYLERLSDDNTLWIWKLDTGLDTLKDRHDHLFDLVMETRDKQKESKEMMKKLMIFLGMPPPPPSPPPAPSFR